MSKAEKVSRRFKRIRKPVSSQYCSATNCTNSRRKCPELSFFRFPKDRERCLKWVENCRRNELQEKDPNLLYRNYVFCANHFEDSQFMNEALKNKLVWNALPTLFDVADPPLSIAEEKARGCPFFPPSPVLSASSSDNEIPLGSGDVYDNALTGLRTDSGTIHPTQSSVAPNEDELPSEAAANRLLPDTDRFPLLHEMSDDEAMDPRVGFNGNKGLSDASGGKKPLRLASIVLTPQQLRQIKTRKLINRQRIKIWRLKKQVQQLKTKVKMCDGVEDVIQGASKYMSGLPLAFFANQIRIASKRSQGKRWTREDKLFALTLQCSSAEAYRLCSRVFNLPSPRTLQRWLKDLKKDPNFEENELKTFNENLLKCTEDDDEDREADAPGISMAPPLTAASDGKAVALVVQDTPNPNDEATAAFLQALVIRDSELCLDENHFNCSVVSSPSVEAVFGNMGTQSMMTTTTTATPLKTVAGEALEDVTASLSTEKDMRGDEDPTGTSTSEGGEQTTDLSTALLTSLISEDLTLGGQDGSQQVHLELQPGQLEEETLQLFSEANGRTITAVQEIGPDGIVTLTPITKSVPITLSTDTINYEIVTLDVSNEHYLSYKPK